MITRREIASVHALIGPHLRMTPVIDLRLPGIREAVSLKLETLQHSGSFKARGAFANLLATNPAPAKVTAASGGNHGAAVAYAAKMLGVPARIFVPSISSPEKVARIRSFGAEVVQGENYEAARKLAAEWAAQSGAVDVHAYDSEATLLGQGTLAREFEEQSPDLDTVIVAVGGGGLIGGIAGWYGGGIKVVGVETEGCPTLHTALQSGAPVDVKTGGIAADSLGATRIGARPFEIAKAQVAACLLVPDADVKRAQIWLWENLRLITEPGGATAFAALLSGAWKPDGQERVGVVVCGANMSPARFAETVLA